MNAFQAIKTAATGIPSGSGIFARGCLMIIQAALMINRHATEGEKRMLKNNEKQNIKDPLMTIDKPNSKPECRTSPLIDGFYLCNINKPDCEHAFSYGFSYLCRSPVRHEFSKHSA